MGMAWRTVGEQRRLPRCCETNVNSVLNLVFRTGFGLGLDKHGHHYMYWIYDMDERTNGWSVESYYYSGWWIGGGNLN